MWYTEEALKTLQTNPTLSDLYRYMSNKLRGPQYIKESHAYHTVLSTLALAHRPLYLTELKSLVYLPRRVDLADIVRSYSAVVQKQDGIISLRHDTVRDFVRNELLDPVAISETHLRIVKLCFEYLSNNLHKRESLLPEQDQKKLHSNTSIAGSYASLGWMTHIPEISSVFENLEVLEALDCFLNQHVLSWTNSLASINAISHAISQISKLDFVLRSMVSYYHVLQLRS